MAVFEHRYTAVVESPDGYTFEQDYDDFYDLIAFFFSLGEGYRIVEIY